MARRIDRPVRVGYKAGVVRDGTEPGSLFEGRYQILRPIARGGMGLVHLAKQVPLGRSVAIKILQESHLDPSFRSRFFSEAQICAALSHPNLVTLLDYGESSRGALYMVLEYVQGETLDRLLGREIQLPPDRVISLLRQLCGALHHAHQAGVVHRDLKPSNVIVRSSPDGEQVKVLDFGIAKCRSDRTDIQGGADWTLPSRILGTPRFMAPEQIRKQPVDGRTDLYALGIMAYWMLSGRPPFLGDDDATLMNHHLCSPVPPMRLPTPEPELEAWVQRLLRKRPADRPEDAAVCVRELGSVERCRGLEARWAEERSQEADRSLLRRAERQGAVPRVAAVAAALGLTCAAGAAAWALGQGSAHPEADRGTASAETAEPSPAHGVRPDPLPQPQVPEGATGRTDRKRAEDGPSLFRPAVRAGGSQLADPTKSEAVRGKRPARSSSTAAPDRSFVPRPRPEPKPSSRAGTSGQGTPGAAPKGPSDRAEPMDRAGPVEPMQTGPAGEDGPPDAPSLRLPDVRRPRIPVVD